MGGILRLKSTTSAVSTTPVKACRYAQFCENYRQCAKHIERSISQIHYAGEKVFIDFAGHTIVLTAHGQELGRVLDLVVDIVHFGHHH